MRWCIIRFCLLDNFFWQTLHVNDFFLVWLGCTRSASCNILFLLLQSELDLFLVWPWTESLAVASLQNSSGFNITRSLLMFFELTMWVFLCSSIPCTSWERFGLSLVANVGDLRVFWNVLATIFLFVDFKNSLQFLQMFLYHSLHVKEQLFYTDYQHYEAGVK